MAASPNQRRFNQFFNGSNRTSQGPGRRIRKARTTCENYMKDADACRLNGEPCGSPADCENYARRPDLLAEKPPAARREPKEPVAPKERPPEEHIPTPIIGLSAQQPEPVEKPKERPGLRVSDLWDPDAPWVRDFHANDVVIHKYFGRGVVTELADDILYVQFEGAAGLKKLKASFFKENRVMTLKR